MLKQIKKYPSIFTLLPFIAGILLAYFLPIHFNNLILLIILAFSAAIIYLKLQPEFLEHKLFFLYIILLFAIGFIRYELKISDNSNKEIDDLKNRNVILYGTVIEQPEFSGDYVRVLLNSDSLVSSQGVYPSDIKILCRIYRDKYSEQMYKSIGFGDAISIKGKLHELPHKKNPGEFDYGRYLQVHGIDAVLNSYGFDNINIVESSHPDFYKENILYPIKNYSVNIIDKLIPGNESEFMKGLVLGERSGITKRAKEDFVNAGVAHIIAVSGLNVVYVLICASVLLTFIPIKYKYKVLILIVFLFFYMNLTGNVPSIVRAVIMVSVFLISRLLERKPNSYSIVSFAALIILIVDPEQLFDAGFILSFSAVLSIVLLYPKFENLISKLNFYDNLDDGNYLHKALKLLITYLLVTLSAQLGLLPITAIMFEKISVVSLFTNLVVIPLSNIAMAIGFLIILTSLISAWLAGIFASTASAILFILLWFINFSAGFDFSFIETYSFDTALFVFYYIFLLTLFSINKMNYKARLVIIVFLIADLLLLEPIIYRKENVSVAYIDVGDSNSSLISLGDKYYFLINAGSSGINYNSAERTIIPYLKRQKVSKVDILMLSGLDFNEFKNLVYLIINFTVKKVILPIYYKELFENNFVKRVFSKTELTFVDNSISIKSYDNVRFYITPEGSDLQIEFLYGGNNFIFSKSIPFMKRDKQMNSQILRLTEGSSFDLYPPDFIVKINPEKVITSYASSRKKKRQSEIFETALNKLGIETINVSDEGAAIFESDGRGIKRVEWK